MKVVYIAGPFTGKTSWEIECNVREAERYALAIARYGAMPLCPHTNTRFFHGECTPEFWYEGTMELLRRCDAIYMLDRWEVSLGSTNENREAVAIGMPVFYYLRALRDWIKEK